MLAGAEEPPARREGGARATASAADALRAPAVRFAPGEVSAAVERAAGPALVSRAGVRHGPAGSRRPGEPGEPVAAGRPIVARRLVVGHRGASGYRPEHTLASYELAARLGADFIEPDLVSTKDHVLVARHENDITSTTDVADHPELADRRTTKTVDGTERTGWFTEDLTLAELKTLRAVERLPALREGSSRYDGRYEVPTFDEVLALRARLSAELGRTIGVYPETKHPTYFDSIGLSLEEPLVAALVREDLDDADDPVFVESFEPSNLRELHEDGEIDVPLVQLLAPTGAPFDAVAAGSSFTYADALTPAGLQFVATYATAIAPDKSQVIPRTADDALGEPTTLVDDAHAAGLQVHPYTFRSEETFLPQSPPTAVEEQRRFWETGIDAMFTDQADTAVASRGLEEDDEQG